MIGNQTPSRDFTVYFTCIQSSTKIVLGFETIYGIPHMLPFFPLGDFCK